MPSDTLEGPPDAALRRALGALGAFVIAFAAFALAHILPPAPYGLADDWRVFYAAAHVVQQGGNPYDSATIHAAEQSAQHYSNVQRSLDDFTDLPVVAALLLAVAWLPYWASFAAFTAAGVCLCGLALLAYLRTLQWRKRAAWLVVALCSWPMLLGLFAGQFDALLLAGVIGALLLMKRDMPRLAGLCMLVVLLKPHVLWPLPPLLFLTWLPARRRAIRFGAVSFGVLLVGALIGFVLVPGSGAFLQHALGFESRVGSVQPDLSGIPGLLTVVPGRGVIDTGVAIAGAMAVVALAFMTVRSKSLRALADGQKNLVPLVGLAVWLACTPYAHPNDDVLLFPLLALLIGVQGRDISARWLQLGVCGCLLTASAFLASPPLGYAVVVFLLSLLAIERRRLGRDALASVSLAALALLPVVWPFHILPLSLTPIAVSLTAVAGVLRLRAEVAAWAAAQLQDRPPRRPMGALQRA